MDRKLCSIQRISSLEPIEGADRIELAKVLGWQTVVKKGEFKPGELVIFCEIDSVMPDTHNFSWLKSRRIKTMRLRGCLSQGLCLPLTYLAEGQVVVEDMDVTKMLGCTKYNSDKVLSHAEAKGEWPSFLIKSGATRSQSSRVKLVGQPGYITEKLDGTSATYYVYRGTFGLCSRNLELQEEGKSPYHYCATKYDIKERLLSGYTNVAIQGEIVGPGIQGNRYGLDEVEFYMYAAYDLNTRDRYSDISLNLVSDYLGVPLVPRIHTGTIPTYVYGLSPLNQRQSLLNPNVLAEGMVINLRDHQTLYKVINPEYLLKHGL